MKQVIIKTLPFLILLIGLSSCLKEAPMNIDVSKTNNVIEFNNTGDNKATASSEFPRFHSDLGTIAPGDSATFNVNVSYSGADVAPQDITVTLAVDEAALEKYNAEDGTDYVVPPSTIYSLPTTVVIKQGTQQTQIKVSIISSSDFDFNVNYALPLKITTVSTGIISANFSTAIYSFGARNQRDGHYTVNGTFSDITNPAFASIYPMDISFITSSGNSVDVYNNDLGNYGYLFYTGSGYSYYGSFGVRIFFDATGKVTSVTNIYGQPAPNTRSAMLDPSGVNAFDENGNLKIKYYMLQPSAVPGDPAIRCYFDETYEYLGPR